MGMGYGHMGGFGMPWIMLGMLIFWTILLLAGLFLLKNFIAEKPRTSDSDQGALELLKLRLVKGEITEEEYKRLRELITKN